MSPPCFKPQALREHCWISPFFHGAVSWAHIMHSDSLVRNLSPWDYNPWCMSQRQQQHLGFNREAGNWISQPRRDSNPQSSDPKSDALSIRPRGLSAIICHLFFATPSVHRFCIRLVDMNSDRWAHVVVGSQDVVSALSQLLERCLSWECLSKRNCCSCIETEMMSWVLRICLHKATEKSVFCISSLGRYGEGSPDLGVVSTIPQPKELSTWFVFNASKEAYFQIELQKVQKGCGLFGRRSWQHLSGRILPTFNLGMTWRQVSLSHLPKSSRLYWRVHCSKCNWDAWTGTWTLDPQIKSLMLYRLSYPGPG